MSCVVVVLGALWAFGTCCVAWLFTNRVFTSGAIGTLAVRVTVCTAVVIPGAIALCVVAPSPMVIPPVNRSILFVSRNAAVP